MLFRSVLYAHQMDRAVERTVGRGGTKSIWFSLDRVALRHAPTPAEQYARLLQERYPALCVENASSLLASLRTIKTAEEIECIRTASNATLDALTFMLKTAKTGEIEGQWAADYHYQVERCGMRNAFPTIAASGENAVMLHYCDNNCKTRDGVMILYAVGAE